MDRGDRSNHSGLGLIGGATTVAAILLFVGIGSSVLASALKAEFVHGAQPDRGLVVALLLNVALILFGWRRNGALRREVDKRTASEQRAKHLAAHDPLTGFLNRRSLAEQGAGVVTQAQRRGKAVALLMIDLDHFKTVNDMHGHAVGDALLQQVAAALAAEMPHGALTARLGGDEFACVLIFEGDHPDTVDRIAERVVTRLAQPFAINAVQVHVSSSVGVARSDADCASIDALVRAGDLAMYAAKQAGRNRFAWFSQAMERERQARNDLKLGLRRAIPSGEVVPYFEQQIDLATGALRGFEMLARWEHPLHGVVPPDQFIPVAEETGMIAELSLSVIRQAMLAARDWDRSLTLSVNISPWQLKDAWFAQKIVKLLAETGFAACRLEIELTEAALFDNLPLAQSIIASLKNQGVRLALDDFGTGYSSLAHLRALPFDRLKIDRSFVSQVATSPESAALVNAIVRLGESLNLPITAEGIETAEIEERLRALGCAYGQGYLYGRPISAARVRGLLVRHNLLRGTAAPPTVEDASVLRSRLAG